MYIFKNMKNKNAIIIAGKIIKALNFKIDQIVVINRVVLPVYNKKMTAFNTFKPKK
jgi:hypothetical protein